MYYQLLFLLVISQAQYNNTQCNLTQIASEFDCLHYKDGNTYWNNSVCFKNTTSPDSGSVEIDTTPTYCNIIGTDKCADDENCALVQGQCTHFSGCSAFTSDEDCESISIRCVSDGKQCVEILQCTDFLTETACQFDENGDYCYWDGTMCELADTCVKLPKTLNSDDQCRNELQQCTVSSTGQGCQESGQQCSDQLIQSQCKWNLQKNQQCYWNGTKCLDYICDNAPRTLITDTQCIQYLSKCTTKLNGGCILRSTCIASTNEAACQTDQQGNDCYWNDEKCVDLICINAPNTFDTNQECQDYLSECITTGKGCIENKGCSSAIIEIACEKYEQQKCIWSNGSCQNIQCQLAPINADCTLFMEDCVPKKSGGCMSLSQCKNYDNEQACIIDINDNECYWNNNQCIDRICSNAPITFITHDECYNYNNDCTINQNGNGCINQTCENTLTKELCIDDYQGNLCIYINKCFSKECSLANYNTALECNNYLNECTLDLSGKGCVQLPLTCQVNIIQAACYFKVGGECGWNQYTKQCIDKSCITADSTYNTNELCNKYLQGCVVSNTIGCMQLPDKCDQRLKQDNCEFEDDTCVWGNQLCQERSCSTATYELQSITINTCKKYINCYSDQKKCCIIDNTGTNCRIKPNTCQELVQSNCTLGSIKGDCFYNGEQCKDMEELTCDDLIALKTHEECQNQLDICTVDTDNIGCINLQNTCNEYTTKEQCHITINDQVCVWKNNLCNLFQDSDCTSAPDSSDYSTDNACQNYQFGCTVASDIGGCVDQFDKCSNYLKKESCYKTITSSIQNCFWYNNQCKTVNTCSDINFLATYSNAICSNYISNCKVNALSPGCIAKECTEYAFTTLEECSSIGCSINNALNQCITKKATCSSYSQADCYYATEGSCFYYQTYNACYLKSKTQCTSLLGDASTCPTYKPICIKGSNGFCATGMCNQQKLTTLNTIQAYNICQAFDLACSNCSNLDQCVNGNDEMFCMEKSFCSQYSKDECFYGLDGYCTLISWNGSFICKSIQSLSQCSQINIDYYQPDICDKFVVGIGCTKSTVSGQQCTDRTCANKPTGIGYTQKICSDWLEGCTNNMDGTKCVEMKDNCIDYTNIIDCPQSAANEQCQIVNGSCVQRLCSYASNTIVSNDQCLSFMNTCAVDKIGGCEKRPNLCSETLLQKQCYFDFYGNRCFWNPTEKKCVDLKCANIEKSSLFSTNDKCKAIQNIDCVISSTGQGCQDNLKSCNSYTTQIQCIEDQYGQECEWFNNECVIKKCSTAPNTLITLKQCVQYYTISKCTTKTGGGCTDQQDTCTKYKDQSSCIITTEQIECGWNENVKECQIKSCLTAPLSYNTYTQCQDYLNICNVSSSGNGCIINPSTCEEMTQLQCQQSDCYYIDNKCITKTCDNIPNENNDCTGYLNTCQSDNIKCKTAICENYEYTTDNECKQIMQECTTDGYKCIPRNTCVQAVHQNGCITQSDGQLCQWLSNGTCVIKKCTTAPNTITSHNECQNYFPNCTSKVGGGCQQYSNQCTLYITSDQCVIDSYGINCVWDNNQCRYKQCIDYTGTNHIQCQKQSNNCTANLQTGRCMNIQECSQYINKQTCIIGIDGTCLWIIDKCYQYSQCEDIQFTTHDECQQVSEYCTTNGITCVPLTYCQYTNINGGCILGIDGECIEIQKDNIKSCVLFESCKQMSYLTHSLCNQAQNNCTTDGITGCIYLSSCSSYIKQDSCYINDIGKVISNNQIQSTGNCIWSNNQCRDQNCSDLQGITNTYCENQLYQCTSDGSKCISKVNCSNYTTECNIAKGDEAYCFWDTKKSICRIIECSDIINPISTQYCKDKNQACTYDGQKCISFAKCADYTTAQACNSKGSDGICAWIPPISVSTAQSQRNICFLMTDCEQGSQDQQSCLQISDRCYFQAATNTQASSCTEHTCQTYYLQNKKCQYFYNFNATIITPCQLDSKNQCSEMTDPSILNSTQCYLLSGYTYTYNTNTSTCNYCSTKRKNSTIKKIDSYIIGAFMIILLV